MTRRKSFQQGYVFERKSKKHGRVFVIRFRVRTADGKWKHRAETIYTGSKKAAKARLASRLAELNNQRYREPHTVTVREFVEGHWDRNMQQRLKNSTMASHRANLRKHILPALGNLTLTDVSTVEIADFISAKRTEGLSPKTLLNIFLLLHRMFKLATVLKLVDSSPVDDALRPIVPRAEKPTLSGTEIRSIIDAVPDNHRTVFVLLVMTGLRIGELLGLKWQDIDFSRSIMHVRRAVWRGKEQSPKTHSTVRDKALSPVATLYLQRHRKLSAYTGPDDYVFASGSGRPLIADDLRKRVLYPAMRRAGMLASAPRAYGFHIFRHSGGSMIHNATRDLKQAQTFLGHSSIAVTGDIYVHAPSDSEVAAVGELEKQVFPDLCSSVLKSTAEPVDGAVN
jgi:integrase